MTATRLVLTILAVAFLAISLTSAEPLAAHKVTLKGDKLTPAMAAKAIRESTSIDIDVSALDSKKTFAIDLQNTDFWNALVQLAEKTGSKVVTTGGRIVLKARQIAGTDVRQRAVSVHRSRSLCAHRPGDLQVWLRDNARSLLGTLADGAFRMDSSPSVVAAKNDLGRTLEVGQGGSRSLTAGNIATLFGTAERAGRNDKTITLTGSVKVTVADKLLTFAFDASKPIAAPSQEWSESRCKIVRRGWNELVRRH